ncbi:MAG: hypothetical protein GX811_07455 [Lentisphaerae bacterium]|nr:hypothetical protein [Lentisphaerota bacterium]
MNQMLFGAAYYPEHRDPGKWGYDLDKMTDAHVNTVRVGEFAWCRFEPYESVYDFDWLDSFKSQAAVRGISLLLCPPLRTVPAWLFQKYPEIAIIRDDGVRLEYGSRYSFCINNPVLLEKGVALAEAMSKHYGKDPHIIGWHLDNEIGDEPDCHCSVCANLFRDWCRTRYGDIKVLNQRWGTIFWGLEFDDFAQIPTPAVTKTFHNPAHLLAWRRFRHDSSVRAIHVLTDAVHSSADQRQFVTTNSQTWNPRTDYYDSSKHLDVCGTNYYPRYGDGEPFNASGLAMCRSYKHANFQVHELRNGAHMIPGAGWNTPAAGEVESLAVHCVANGANSLFFFRWRACPFGCEQSHGAITDYEAEPKKVYNEVQRVFSRLTKISEELKDTVVRSNMAILLDFPTRWVMESGVSWNGPAQLYSDYIKLVYDAARSQHISCDYVNRTQSFECYKLIVVPFLAVMDDELAQKLIDFVAGGGHLVWHPLCGIKDDDAVIYPGRIHPKLRSLFKLDINEFATASANDAFKFDWHGKEYIYRHFCDLLETTQKDQITAVLKDIRLKNMPAVLEIPHGKGKITYLAGFAEKDFYADLFKDLSANQGVRRIFGFSETEGVEIAERFSSDGSSYVFLINLKGEQVTVGVSGAWTDVYNEVRVDTNLKLAPYGVAILRAESDYKQEV